MRRCWYRLQILRRPDHLWVSKDLEGGHVARILFYRSESLRQMMSCHGDCVFQEAKCIGLARVGSRAYSDGLTMQ